MFFIKSKDYKRLLLRRVGGSISLVLTKYGDTFHTDVFNRSIFIAMKGQKKEITLNVPTLCPVIFLWQENSRSFRLLAKLNYLKSPNCRNNSCNLSSRSIILARIILYLLPVINLSRHSLRLLATQGDNICSFQYLALNYGRK